MSTQFEQKLMNENRSIRQRNAELREEIARWKRANAALLKVFKPFAALPVPEDESLCLTISGGTCVQAIKNEWIRSARELVTAKPGVP